MTTTRQSRVEQIARPNRNEVLSAIVSEAEVDRETAASLYDWGRCILGFMRDDGIDHYDLKDAEMKRMHDALDVIMPLDSSPTPGSAHEMYELSFLDPSLGELGLRHTHSMNGNSSRYCTIHIVRVDNAA